MASLQYRPAIDGLRAFAVLSVFIFHLNHSWLPGGFVGVDVFFVISGYLITSIILKDCESGSFSLANFYQRRIARIFPAFFTVALATLAGAAIVYSPQDLASAGANLAFTSLSLANVKFMLQGDYFQISSDAQPFLHYWSLSVEEQFYLVFPLFFISAFKYVRRHLVAILSVLGICSLIACIFLTQSNPVWAFYLLPTRAWELCAGSLLAVVGARSMPGCGVGRASWLQIAGILMIGLSMLLVHEGPLFPGWRAIFPVIGTLAVLSPLAAANQTVERWLSIPLLVLIGRMSYSLYLWHWPVFSLIDYRFYLASDGTRLMLKIALSLLVAACSYYFIENPARNFLNQRRIRVGAFASIIATLAICIPLGVSIRRSNYVNAELADVAKGGIVFKGKAGASSVVLMGDSNGSMYGKVMKEICADLGYKLTVISVAAGDPLPSSTGNQSQLWLDSLAIIQKEKPDYLVLACRWESKLKDDNSRLADAVRALEPSAGKIVILNQPPVLPESATRECVRNGMRPPFIEEHSTGTLRAAANQLVLNLKSPKTSVADIAGHFELPDGEARFLDQSGRQLYHDSSHLSGYGAELIRPVIQAELVLNLN